MGCGLSSGSEAFFLFFQGSSLPDSSRKLGPCSRSDLPFKTRSGKQSISIKAPYGSGGGRARAAINGGVCDAAEAEESFYELLGVPRGGTPSETKKAYKQMALKYHPDVSPPDRAEEYTRAFIRVQEAYRTLSDPNTRALYDRELNKNLGFSARSFQPNQNWEERRERWESQLAELKRRSMNKDSGRRTGEMSWWGARTRRQRRHSFGIRID